MVQRVQVPLKLNPRAGSCCPPGGVSFARGWKLAKIIVILHYASKRRRFPATATDGAT